MKIGLSSLQPLGRALMLPIAVLPVAGLLLRLGQPDLLNIAFLAAAGDAVFANLGLLFAVGVAVDLTARGVGRLRRDAGAGQSRRVGDAEMAAGAGEKGGAAASGGIELLAGGVAAHVEAGVVVAAGEQPVAAGGAVRGGGAEGLLQGGEGG